MPVTRVPHPGPCGPIYRVKLKALLAIADAALSLADMAANYCVGVIAEQAILSARDTFIQRFLCKPHRFSREVRLKR